jgi:hypothetical protein
MNSVSLVVKTTASLGLRVTVPRSGEMSPRKASFDAVGADVTVDDSFLLTG